MTESIQRKPSPVDIPPVSLQEPGDLRKQMESELNLPEYLKNKMVFRHDQAPSSNWPSRAGGGKYERLKE